MTTLDEDIKQAITDIRIEHDGRHGPTSLEDLGVWLEEVYEYDKAPSKSVLHAAIYNMAARDELEYTVTKRGIMAYSLRVRS